MPHRSTLTCADHDCLLPAAVLFACRCGLDIPEDSATNASVSGIRVWCAEPLLVAAAARLAAAAADAAVCPASPELMHRLRTGLQEELSNPRGRINQQVCPVIAAAAGCYN
jgi:hypothetical protein